jgi:hypothetical protein
MATHQAVADPGENSGRAESPIHQFTGIGHRVGIQCMSSIANLLCKSCLRSQVSIPLSIPVRASAYESGTRRLESLKWWFELRPWKPTSASMRYGVKIDPTGNQTDLVVRGIINPDDRESGGRSRVAEIFETFETFENP